MIQEQKEILISDFESYFMKRAFSSLQSRIMGYLILHAGEIGKTFQDVVSWSGASKSSVSEALAVLLHLRVIIYKKCPASRKRYFRYCNFSEMVHNHKKTVEAEKNIVSKLLLYRKRMQEGELNESNLQNIRSYGLFLSDLDAFLEGALEKFSKSEGIFR